MADKKATLHIEGKAPVELPIIGGTEGPEVIDVRQLGANGYFTFDPGFLATASCESQITYIDGDKGILLHRGYPIDQLANNADYLEVCYILLYGEVPTREQYETFRTTVTRHTMVHEQISSFFHASVVMLTLWPLCVVWWVHLPPSITIHWISITIPTAKSLHSACCLKCRHWLQCVTSIPSASRSFSHEMIWTTPRTSCT